MAIFFIVKIEYMFYNFNSGDIMSDRIIFHVDVNNAFLSWTAVKMLKEGSKVDIRKIPSVIGGSEKDRHGIVLAKSPIAKKFGVVSAETLYSARKKCPSLKVFPPDYRYYYQQSNLFYNYLSTLTPVIERYSVDECFLDLTGTSLIYKDYLKLAYEIKEHIKNEFGFTVNVGIGNNKLCAKMASDFEKPDKVHTLYSNEIEEKMWTLDVGDLFMVGRSSAKTLRSIGIKTIGELANCDELFLKKYFKNQVSFLKNSANGIDDSRVTPRESKTDSISISETLPYDCSDKDKIKEILFRQTDEVTRSLRMQGEFAKTVAITYKNNLFQSYQHQKKLSNPSNSITDIYSVVVDILEESWRDDSIRNIGVRLADFCKDRKEQVSIFEEVKEEKENPVQNIIDDINKKYGRASVMPASIKKIGRSNRLKK